MLTPEVAEPLVAVVALSMVMTPLLMILHDRVVQPRFVLTEPERELTPSTRTKTR